MDYERRMHVAQQPAETFAFLCDENRLLQWRDGLIAFRRLDDAPESTTRRYVETVATPLGAQSVTVTLAADLANHRLSFAVLDGPVRPRGTIALRADSGGTELRYRLTYEPLLPFVTPLDRRVFATLTGSVDRSLERLHRLLAAGTTLADCGEKRH